LVPPCPAPTGSESFFFLFSCVRLDRSACAITQIRIFVCRGFPLIFPSFPALSHCISPPPPCPHPLLCPPRPMSILGFWYVSRRPDSDVHEPSSANKTPRSVMMFLYAHTHTTHTHTHSHSHIHKHTHTQTHTHTHTQTHSLTHTHTHTHITTASRRHRVTVPTGRLGQLKERTRASLRAGGTNSQSQYIMASYGKKCEGTDFLRGY
jgi:hypothetical protein